MTFSECRVRGAYVVELEPVHDERGFFARIFSAAEFVAFGLEPVIAESSFSYNRVAHTLRGLHYQAAPYEEAKLVRCTRGSIYDVVIDLRRDSPTYALWDAAELTASNRRALYAPPGTAHGYLTLEDDTELLYNISRPHIPSAGRGVRFDDPLFGIDWPAAPRVIAARDASYPDFDQRL
jgi:dTDP-4-dehydrorhamnose 3,5-epimerase